MTDGSISPNSTGIGPRCSKLVSSRRYARCYSTFVIERYLIPLYSDFQIGRSRWCMNKVFISRRFLRSCSRSKWRTRTDVKKTGMQDVTCLVSPLEYRVLDCTLQTFDACMNPTFCILKRIRAIQDRRLPTFSTFPAKRRNIRLRVGILLINHLCSPLPYYDWWLVYDVSLNLCQLSSTLRGWPALSFFERGTNCCWIPALIYSFHCVRCFLVAYTTPCL